MLMSIEENVINEEKKIYLYDGLYDIIPMKIIMGRCGFRYCLLKFNKLKFCLK